MSPKMKTVSNLLAQVLTSSERSSWCFRSCGNCRVLVHFCVSACNAGHLETSLCSIGAMVGSTQHIGVSELLVYIIRFQQISTRSDE